MQTTQKKEDFSRHSYIKVWNPCQCPATGQRANVVLWLDNSCPSQSRTSEIDQTGALAGLCESQGPFMLQYAKLVNMKENGKQRYRTTASIVVHFPVNSPNQELAVLFLWKCAHTRLCRVNLYPLSDSEVAFHFNSDFSATFPASYTSKDRYSIVTSNHMKL